MSVQIGETREIGYRLRGQFPTRFGRRVEELVYRVRRSQPPFVQHRHKRPETGPR